MYEHAGAHPQPLSLPMPGPCKACQGDHAEYRFMPCRGPADGPISHQGELVYAGHCQVNHDQEEHDPPVEERAQPAVGRRTCGALTKLTRILLLWAHWCYVSYLTARLS